MTRFSMHVLVPTHHYYVEEKAFDSMKMFELLNFDFSF